MRGRRNSIPRRTISAGNDQIGIPILPGLIMLKYLKGLFTGTETPFLQTPASYPGAMAELAEYIILLQAKGTVAGNGRNDTLVRLATTLSRDPYCLGYVAGMFESLCQQWEVPAQECRLVAGSATTILLRDLLESCKDTRRVTFIEDAAFNGLLNYASDPGFVRGRFDGCTELTRYATTKEQADMPLKLRERLQAINTPSRPTSPA